MSNLARPANNPGSAAAAGGGILHIAADERFIDRGIAIFEEALPGQNRYLAWSHQCDGSLEHIRGLTPQNGRVATPRDKWWEKGYIDWSRYRAVVCHNLYSHPQIFLANQAPRRLPVCWLFYGAEYYNDAHFYKAETYGPLTKALPRKKRAKLAKAPPSQRLAAFIKSRFSRSFRAKNPRAIDKQRAFERADFFGTHLPNEMELIKQSLGISPRWLNFSYYTIEDYISVEADSVEKRPQLVLGNSATASNNHLEALEILQRIGYGGDILCPLSYGDDTYKPALLAEATARFGARFRSIDEYLSFDDYSRLIANSEAMVMNHYRQQALGTIITALWFGTRVFVSNRSPVLPYFKDLGCVIHSVEDELANAQALRPLSPDETSRNRSLLGRAYARSTFVEAIRKMDTAGA